VGTPADFFHDGEDGTEYDSSSSPLATGPDIEIGPLRISAPAGTDTDLDSSISGSNSPYNPPPSTSTSIGTGNYNDYNEYRLPEAPLANVPEKNEVLEWEY
jgi:hypothetical protein